MKFFRRRLCFPFLLVLWTVSNAFAQVGATVQVSPMGLENDYHPAVLLQQSGNSWFVRMTSGKYAGQEFVVLKDWVRASAPAAPAPAAPAPTAPAPAAPVPAAPAPAAPAQGGLEVGSAVMATPMGLENGYDPAVVVGVNNGGFNVRFTAGKYAGQEFAVLKDWVRPAGAAAAAPQQAPQQAPAANAGQDPWAQMQRDIEQTIADSKRPPAPPAAVSGATPLNGLYLRQEQTFQGTALNHREDYYYFFPDGRVYHGVPPEGPSHFQWQAETQRNPDRCGRYGIEGDRITFSWMTGRTYTWKISGTGNEFDLNMSPTVKAERFPSPARISGTYDRGSVNTAPGLPTVALSTSYTFALDGTVTMGGMKGTDTTTVTATINETGRGTYTLSGNDLEIRWGGEVWRCTAFPVPGGTASPPSISINGALFVRR